MARTKASVGSKVAAGKSNKAQCSVPAPAASVSRTSSAGSSEKATRSGGNTVCPRETPRWQKPITTFFVSTPQPRASRAMDDAEEGPSRPKKKQTIIYSDDEEEPSPPKNRELDESIILEPLSGETCHKMEEYFPEEKPKEQDDKVSDDLDIEDENVDGKTGDIDVKDTDGENVDEAHKTGGDNNEKDGEKQSSEQNSKNDNPDDIGEDEIDDEVANINNENETNDIKTKVEINTNKRDKINSLKDSKKIDTTEEGKENNVIDINKGTVKLSNKTKGKKRDLEESDIEPVGKKLKTDRV